MAQAAAWRRMLRSVGLHGAAHRLAARVAAPRRRAQQLAFYRDVMGEGDLVFDVGANHGDRTAIFRATGARVVAVEPQRRLAEALARRFRSDPGVAVVQAAVGAAPRRAKLRLNEADTLATLSPEWIEATTASGRFTDYAWSGEEEVEVTTLDRLIGEHGSPRFVKIDVEGYEVPVLEGLTRPVGGVSIEFAPEYLASTTRCIELLASRGEPEFNYTLGERLEFRLARWTDAKGITEAVGATRSDPASFGDFYARFPAWRA